MVKKSQSDMGLLYRRVAGFGGDVVATLRTLTRRVARQIVAAGGADVVAQCSALAPFDEPDARQDGEDESGEPVGDQ